MMPRLTVPYARVAVGSWRRIARKIPFIGLALLSAICSGPSWAASCPQDGGFHLEVNQIKGVRAKWEQSSELRDGRYSIQPALEGLPVGEWMKKLEEVGVNLTDLNLDPCRRLVSNCNPKARSLPPPPDAQTFSNYMAALYAAPAGAAAANRSDQAASIATVRSRIVSYGYTPDQRNEVLLDFLKRLEAAKNKGEIAGNVRFILHQRLWFRSRQMDRPDARARVEGEFISDMAGFINAARAQCLDHWIAGIRLGEHANKNMDQMLPVLVDLARGVNDRTGGWLRSRMMLSNGGGWGAIYNGINHVEGRDGAPFDFFKQISAETGSFAFGYKWMDSDIGPRRAAGIQRQMAQSDCGRNGNAHRCEASSAGDWETYLRVNDGFDDLVSFIRANGSRYPKYANVMFVGDSSDSLRQLLVPSSDGGSLTDSPALSALRRMFSDAAKGGGGWTGRLFVNAFADRDQKSGDDDGPDLGRALYYADSSPKNLEYGPVRIAPRTLAEWQSWPAPAQAGSPNHPAKPKH